MFFFDGGGGGGARRGDKEGVGDIFFFLGINFFLFIFLYIECRVPVG